MPLLSYSAITDYPFTPFNKIYSADINLMFSTVQTLLNTTKLDSTNIQAHALTRYTSASNLAAGTANYAVFNDSNGDLTEAAAVTGTPTGGTTGNPIIFPTVTYDTNAAYNASTGTYTVPISGFYRVHGYLKTSTSAAVISCYVNGVLIVDLGLNQAQGAGLDNSTLTGSVKVNAGDLITIRPNGGQTFTGNSFAYFERIGGVM